MLASTACSRALRYSIISSPGHIRPPVAPDWVLRMLQFLEEFLRRESPGPEAGRLHRPLDAPEDGFELGQIGLVLLPRTLDGLLLAQSESTKTAILLSGVVELRMNARIPDQIHMKPIFEEEAAVLLLPPHPEPVRIERHHLRLLSPLFVDVVVEKISEMLGNLVAELNAHADIGNTAKQRLKHRLVLVAIAVRGKVREDPSQLVTSDERPVGAHHDVVPNGEIAQRQQLAHRRYFEPSIVFCLGHRHS